MVSKGFPNVTTSGRQYNIGEKPSVILYTYINLHAGLVPQSFLSKSPGLQCSNMVLHGLRAVLMGTKSCTKILNFSTRFWCENLAVEDFVTLLMGKKSC